MVFTVDGRGKGGVRKESRDWLEYMQEEHWYEHIWICGVIIVHDAMLDVRRRIGEGV